MNGSLIRHFNSTSEWDLILKKGAEAAFQGGVLRKRCPENMHQIYRRTPIPKCNVKKITKQLYLNQTLASAFSCKFGAYFYKNTYGGLHLKMVLDRKIHWKHNYSRIIHLHFR